MTLVVNSLVPSTKFIKSKMGENYYYTHSPFVFSSLFGHIYTRSSWTWSAWAFV